MLHIKVLSFLTAFVFLLMPTKVSAQIIGWDCVSTSCVACYSPGNPSGDCLNEGLPGVPYVQECQCREACQGVANACAAYSQASYSSTPGTPPAVGPVTSGTCNSNTGIQTAIGCISLLETNGLTGFVGFFLRWGGGLVGGIGLMMIIYSGYMIMTSAGDPKKLQAGKELLGASAAGILMLIFAGFILRIIGADILQIFR